MSSDKWKSSLLSSGLPLEYLAAQKLSEKGFNIFGEYQYTKRNEQNVETEFSADLHVSRGSFPNMIKLHLLVECKYRHQNTKWVFYPYPANDHSTCEIATIIQGLCTRRIKDLDNRLSLDETIKHCVRGTESFNDGDNPKEISRGLSQLRYATPNLATECIKKQISAIKENKDYDLHIYIICPMLITTASLYVIKQGLNLDNFHNASALTDVAEEVDSFIITQQPSPQLTEYSNELLIKSSIIDSDLEIYMGRLGEILSKKGIAEEMKPNSYKLLYDVTSSNEQIIVINYESMEKWVDKIIDRVSNLSSKPYTELHVETRQSETSSPIQIYFSDELAQFE